MIGISFEADELVAFALRDDWTDEMLDAATEATLATREQWKIFVDEMGEMK